MRKNERGAFQQSMSPRPSDGVSATHTDAARPHIPSAHGRIRPRRGQTSEAPAPQQPVRASRVPLPSLSPGLPPTSWERHSQPRVRGSYDRRPTRNLSQAMDEYAAYLAHEQHASSTTQVGYKSWLRRFRRFATERYGREPALAELTVEDLRSYLYSLSEQRLRPRTLRGAMYPLRGLFALAVERGHRADNPALGVKLPKKDAALRETVSDADLERLVSGCERHANSERRRMSKAVLAVLVYGGLRRQELLDLQVSDNDLGEGKVLVRSGKGAKSRSLFVCQPCVQALRAWLSVRPSSNHPYLFIADRGRRLGEVGLVRLIEEAKSLADLRDGSNIKPHSIRHAAATRLMRNGADLRSIQQFLGHSQLQTTAIYLHTDEQQLQRIAEFSAFKERTPAKREDPATAEPEASCTFRIPLRRRQR